MPKDNAARSGNNDREPDPLQALAGGRTKSEKAGAEDILYERSRLAIVSALAVNPSLSFSELKQLLGLSDGNLSVHAQKLEAAGLIRCTKSFRGRSPRTEYRLTDKGRRALNKYLKHMEAVIRTVREG